MRRWRRERNCWRRRRRIMRGCRREKAVSRRRRRWRGSDQSRNPKFGAEKDLTTEGAEVGTQNPQRMQNAKERTAVHIKESKRDSSTTSRKPGGSPLGMTIIAI